MDKNLYRVDYFEKEMSYTVIFDFNTGLVYTRNNYRNDCSVTIKEDNFLIQQLQYLGGLFRFDEDPPYQYTGMVIRDTLYTYSIFNLIIITILQIIEKR